MKSRFLILLLTIGGCTSYYAVDVSSANEAAALNILARKHGTAVVLADGTVMKAENVHISPDTISWQDPETHVPIRKRSSRISEIRLNRKDYGVSDGMMVGGA